MDIIVHINEWLLSDAGRGLRSTALFPSALFTSDKKPSRADC